MTSPRHPASSIRALLALTALALASLGAAEVHAQSTPLPVVKLDYTGDVPKLVQNEVDAAIDTVVKNDGRKLALLDAAATRKRLFDLSPALSGCVTADCLKRVGELLNATAAVSIVVQGEAQIYDMEIVVYDLGAGKTAASEKFSCDICTAKETATRFAATFTTVLGRADIKRPAATVKTIAEATPPVETVKTLPVDKKTEKTPESVKTHVVLTAVPDTSTIALDGTRVGTGTAALELAVGVYMVRVEAEGYAPSELPLRVDPGAEGPIKLDLSLEPLPAVETPVAPPVAEDGDGSRLVIGAVALAAGLGGLIGGAVLLSMDGDTTCSTGAINQCPNVYETSALGTSLVALGTASATTGMFLLLWNTLTERAPAPAATAPASMLGVGVDAEGVAIQWGGTF